MTSFLSACRVRGSAVASGRAWDRHPHSRQNNATAGVQGLSLEGEEFKVAHMRRRLWVAISASVFLSPILAHAENAVGQVKKAVEHITLDQPGTKPFHLKATVAPSFERDKDSGRIGSVEIWWQSPTRWRRELRSPDFHQIEVVDGTRDWQKNEGDFFPE
jgi:hypothetical protein